MDEKRSKREWKKKTSRQNGFGVKGIMMLLLCILTLKVPIVIAADDIHKYFSLFFRENKA